MSTPNLEKKADEDFSVAGAETALIEAFSESEQEKRELSELSESEADLIVKRLLSDGSTFRLHYEIEKIKEKQIKLAADLETIKRFIKWRQAWFLIRTLIILIPIILGIIFLPGYLKDLLATLPDKFYY